MFELYIKYLLEGIAVAIAAYFIPRKKVEVTEIIFIALSAAATFARSGNLSSRPRPRSRGGRVAAARGAGATRPGQLAAR